MAKAQKEFENQEISLLKLQIENISETLKLRDQELADLKAAYEAELEQKQQLLQQIAELVTTNQSLLDQIKHKDQQYDQLKSKYEQKVQEFDQLSKSFTVRWKI